MNLVGCLSLLLCLVLPGVRWLSVAFLATRFVGLRSSPAPFTSKLLLDSLIVPSGTNTWRRWASEFDLCFINVSPFSCVRFT